MSCLSLPLPISKRLPHHSSTIQLSGPVSIFSSSPLMPIGESVAGSRQQNNRPDLPPKSPGIPEYWSLGTSFIRSSSSSQEVLHTSHLHREVVKDTWKSKAAVADLCPSQDFKGQYHKNPIGFMGEDVFIKAYWSLIAGSKLYISPLDTKLPTSLPGRIRHWKERSNNRSSLPQSSWL